MIVRFSEFNEALGRYHPMKQKKTSPIATTLQSRFLMCSRNARDQKKKGTNEEKHDGTSECYKTMSQNKNFHRPQSK